MSMETWMEGIFREGGKYVERIAIRTPVWSSHKVGIAAYRAKRADVIEVKVKYRKDKDGKELLPKVLTIPVAKVRTYPVKEVGGGTMLHMVPIADMEEVHGQI
jgi:hypothetical protein